MPLPAPFAPPPWPTPGGFFASGLRIAGPAGFTGGELEGAGSAVLGAGAGLLAAGLGLAFPEVQRARAGGLGGRGLRLGGAGLRLLFAASTLLLLALGLLGGASPRLDPADLGLEVGGTARLALVRRSR